MGIWANSSGSILDNQKKEPNVRLMFIASFYHLIRHHLWLTRTSFWGLTFQNFLYYLPHCIRPNWQLLCGMFRKLHFIPLPFKTCSPSQFLKYTVSHHFIKIHVTAQISHISLHNRSKDHLSNSLLHNADMTQHWMHHNTKVIWRSHHYGTGVVWQPITQP